MIQLTENRQFTTRYGVLIGLIVWVAVIGGTGLIARDELLDAVRYLGIATLASGFAVALLNRWLWKVWPFRALLKIPDFSGRWEGWSRPGLQPEWRATAHEIVQQGVDFSVTAWGPHNLSRGVSAAIIVDAHGLVAELVWVYRTEAVGTTYDGGDTHTGVHLLRLSKHDGAFFLEGKYINDRARRDGTKGAVGEIRLKRVSQKFQSCLNFNPETWGMSRPEKMATLPAGSPLMPTSGRPTE